MSQHDDDQDLNADAQAISDDATSLLQRISFAAPLQELNDRYAKLQQLHDELRRLRSRGFSFWPNLEQQLAEARRTADHAIGTARNESQRAAQQLRQQAEALGRNAANLASRNRLSVAQVDGVASERDRLEAQTQAVEQRIASVAEPFTKLVDTVSAGVAGAHWTMDQFDQASFRVRAEESPLAVAAATWEDCPQGAAPGVIYLTDLMIRFERTTGQRSTMIERAIGHIASSEDSERGWFMKDEVLTLRFQPNTGNPMSAVFVLGSADSKSFDDFIERARSGQLEAWRVQRTAQSAPVAHSAAMPLKWPSKCDNCGAAIVAPVRGQTEVVCAYCKARYAVEFAKS
ncbi:MAG: hypothetical protein Q8Q09_25600 [Deltaproteobacteria bacterium]|nr:hypothetical protein [Deltaproteobacteria bacterium]